MFFSALASHPPVGHGAPHTISGPAGPCRFHDPYRAPPDSALRSLERKEPRGPRLTTIVLLIVALVFLWVVFAFNRLVRLRNQVRTAWADIDVQLTRRHDLVPQLVAAVQGYAGHEQAVLRAVTELRAQAAGTAQPGAARRSRIRARTGARPPVRAEGGLSGPQGERELRSAAARPGRSGGTPAVRAALLQRRGARLQRRRPACPRPARRAHVPASPRPSSSRHATTSARPVQVAAVMTKRVLLIACCACWLRRGAPSPRSASSPTTATIDIRRRRQPGRHRSASRVRAEGTDPPRHLSRLPDALRGSLRQPRGRRFRGARRAARRRERAVVHREQWPTACASTPATTTSCRCRPSTPTRCAIAPRASSASSPITTSCTGTRSAPAGRSRSIAAASTCACP